MKILVDTNVLLRLVQIGHSQQQPAEQSVTVLRREGHELRIVPQNLYEYWVVATRPAERNGLGFKPSDVATQVLALKKLFIPLRDERGILEHWQAIVTSLAVEGKSAHDARLVAAMKRHDLTHLLTFNLDDFRRYSEVSLLDPVALATRL